MIWFAFLQGCADSFSLESFQDKLSNAVNTASSGIVFIHIETTVTTDGNVVTSSSRMGAGVIIDPTGTLITTCSAILDGKKFTVMFQDGCTHKATLVGMDMETNLAVLKTDNHEHGCFPVPIEIGLIRNAGTIGLIMGHTTISKGIATSWGVLSESWMGGDDFIADPLYCIQTGGLLTKSGTVVVDVTGKLIGICDNFISGNRGIWTIIPVSTIVEVAKLLSDEGKIDRGWLGICCEPYPGGANNTLSGVQVTEVVIGSPAEISGISIGDRIVSIDGLEINESTVLRKKISGISPVNLTALRIYDKAGQVKNIKLNLVKLSADPDRQRHCPSRTL